MSDNRDLVPPSSGEMQQYDKWLDQRFASLAIKDMNALDADRLTRFLAELDGDISKIEPVWQWRAYGESVDRRNFPADTLSVLADSIPNELKILPHWVCWDYGFDFIPSETIHQNRTYKKVPVDPHTGGAPTSSSESWATFELAQEFKNKEGLPGLGLVFTNGTPFVGLDIDGCVDRSKADALTHGILSRLGLRSGIEDSALKVARTLNSYTEISPKGTGLHILFEGEVRGIFEQKAPEGRYRSGTWEYYEIAQMPLAEALRLQPGVYGFLTVTGHRVSAFPKTPLERTHAFRKLYANMTSYASAARSETRDQVRRLGQDGVLPTDSLSGVFIYGSMILNEVLELFHHGGQCTRINAWTGEFIERILIESSSELKDRLHDPSVSRGRQYTGKNGQVRTVFDLGTNAVIVTSHSASGFSKSVPLLEETKMTAMSGPAILR